ncbi:MAG: hypothetical protein RLO81_12500 [Fulvivirga sp.]
MKLLATFILILALASCSEENPVRQTNVVESRWVEIVNESQLAQVCDLG